MSSDPSFLDRLKSSALVQAVMTKIRNKIIVGFLGVSLIPLAALGVILYGTSADALMSQAGRQLTSVRTLKANQVAAYFQTIEDQIVTMSENQMVVDAMRQFPSLLANARQENGLNDAQMVQLKEQLYRYYADDFSQEYKGRNDGKSPPISDQFNQLDLDSIFLQHQYIRANPNPLGEKENLDRASDLSGYSELHGSFHPVIRSFLRKFGYYDIFLCDIQSGDIVYSVFKELDYTTSLIDGPYSQTNFGKAFRLAAAAETKDSVYLVDYEPYLPSYEDAASFISSPIFDGDKKIGVLIFQMPIDRIEAIFAERTGLGETGETYAVGPDNLFRNDSYYLSELGVDSTIINPKLAVESHAAQEALTDKSGVEELTNYRDAKVLSSYGPVTVFKGESVGAEPIRWALLSEIELSEVRAPIFAMGVAWKTSVVGGLALLLGAGVAVLFARGMTRQAESISDMLSSIGIGDYSARVDVITDDELGTVATALNAMCDNTFSLIQSREERDEIQQSITELMSELEGIAAGDLTIEAAVRNDITGSIATSINYMIGQLREIIQNVQRATLQVSSSATQIQAATEHLSEGSDSQAKQIVATSTAVDEMASSIQQVAENTAESSAVAEEARQNASRGSDAVRDTINGMERIRDQVQETSKRIKRLGESSQEIGEIVQLISDIADRTSILALNASIQAAMAGDAGQGFAVVAEEVERLAERSNEATKQIATLIKAIQSETSEAMTGMEESTREVVEGSRLAVEAGRRLNEIDSVSNRLAELISQISLAAKQQARGADAIAGAMTEISQVTQQTSAGTKQAAVSVSQLAALADELRNSVRRFRVDSGVAGAQAPASIGAPIVTAPATTMPPGANV